MHSSPSISVVVPFFNSERHIGACIEGLQNQKGFDDPYELIFVNNRSADGSAAIVSRSAGVVLVEEDLPGAYTARNTGIRQARAPIVAFTDADCKVDTDWLQSIRDGMRDPSVAVLLGYCRYPADASPRLKLLGAYENAKADYVLNHCPADYHFAYANNMAVRAEVFAQVGPFQEWPRAADTELIHRLAKRLPDLRVAYNRAMTITHLEFVGARSRFARLRLYTKTNSKIESFRELSLIQRLAALGCLWTRNRA